jgi:flagellar biosynthesis protein FlhG
VAIIKYKIPGSAPDSDVHVNIPSRTSGHFPGDDKTIWAIGGGKGGIGKTILTSNMAVYLSWLNKRVVVVDLDLGGSNLHTSLGVASPTRTLSDLVTGATDDIHDLLQPTPIRNLQIISGAQDPVGITNLRHIQKARLMRKLAEIDADFILLDLGAGTSSNTLDFFLAADQKIVLVTPEPTSIENAYRFIKLAFYRMLRSSTPSPHVRHLVEQAMDLKTTGGIRTPKDLLAEVRRLSPTEGADLQQRMEQFKLSIIVNQVRAKSEADIGKSVLLVCERYFGMSVDYMGYLPYDSAVWQSIRHRVPFLVDAPNSVAVTHLEAIMRNLLRTPQAKAG